MTTDVQALNDEYNEHRTLVDSLARIRALKQQKKAIEDELRDLEGPVRAWLEEHREPLVDLERGITAELKERNLPASIDLIAAAQHPENDTHLARAAGMGLLKADLTALRHQRGRVECADALLAYEMPGGVSYVLNIEGVAG